MARKRGRMVDGVYVEEADAVPRETPDPAIDVRKDGSIRRPGAGGRTLHEFFADANVRRALTREEYLNLRSVEEYHRRERRFGGLIAQTGS